MLGRFGFCIAALLTCSSAPIAALEVNASAGFGLDSAASLEDVDPNAGSQNADGDTVWMFEAGLSGQISDSLSLSYDFSTEEFADYSENSSTSHSLGGMFEKEIGNWSYSLGGDYISMALDGSDYLDMTMLIPSLGYFRNQTYLMTSAIYQDKSFVEMTQLDADMAQYSLLALQFFNNYKSNFIFGYSIADEDAATDDYDFDETKWSIGVTHPVSFGGRNYKAKISYEMRSRDYPKVSDAQLKSEEDRDRFQLRLTTRLSDHLDLEFDFDYKDRKADIADATYSSHLTALKLNYRR